MKARIIMWPKGKLLQVSFLPLLDTIKRAGFVDVEPAQQYRGLCSEGLALHLMLCCLELFWFFNKGPCIFTSSWAPQTVSPVLPMRFLQVTLCLLGCHWSVPGSLWALLRAGVPASANPSILSIGIRKWNSSIPSSSWTNKQVPFVYGFSCLQGKQSYQRDHSRGFSYTVPQSWPLGAQLQCLFCSVTGLAQVSVSDSCSVVSNSWPPRGLAQQVPLSMGFSRQEYWSGLPFPSSRIQFSSVQSLRRVRLCEPQHARPPCPSPTPKLMSMESEFTQTHVHWLSDAIQPAHPLWCPCPPALNLTQHQDLFKWVSSSHQVAKVLQSQLQHQSLQWTPRTDFL